jgi:hypothetical protein
LGVLVSKFFLIFLFLLSSLKSDNIKIYFSYGLDGNVKACTCAIVPLAGLSRRADFLEKIKLNSVDDILIEGGDYLGKGITDVSKYNSIYESFLGLKYHLLGTGIGEIKYANGFDFSKSYFPQIASNTISKLNKKSFKQIETIYRKGLKISYVSLLSDSDSNLSKIYLEDYDYLSPQEALESILKNYISDFWIITFNGKDSEMNKIAGILQNQKYLLIQMDSNPSNNPPKSIKSKNGILYYSLTSNHGNTIYNWTLNEKTLKINQFEKLDMDVDQLRDNTIIEKIIKKYKLD